MSNDKTIVRTASGIEAVLTLIQSKNAIVLEAVANPSDVTREFDENFEQQMRNYAEAAATKGIRHAGEPPLSGAHVLLKDIRVDAPKSLQGIGREIKSVGGTGTEWTIRWKWDLTGITPSEGTLVISTDVDSSTIALVPA